MSSEEKSKATSKQKTLAALGFSVKMKSSGGSLVDIVIPETIDEVKKFSCRYCTRKFLKPCGLSVHIKCVHGDMDVDKAHTNKEGDDEIADPNMNVRAVTDDKKADYESVDGEENIVKDNDGGSQHEKVAENDVGTVDEESANKKGDKRKGAVKRKVYSMNVKAEAINDVDDQSMYILR